MTARTHNPRVYEMMSGVAYNGNADLVFPNADFDYHECGIWIALNAPEMVEVDE